LIWLVLKKIKIQKKKKSKFAKKKRKEKEKEKVEGPVWKPSNILPINTEKKFIGKEGETIQRKQFRANKKNPNAILSIKGAAAPPSLEKPKLTASYPSPTHAWTQAFFPLSQPT
jgi:hypothetical protein